MYGLGELNISESEPGLRMEEEEEEDEELGNPIGRREAHRDEESRVPGLASIQTIEQRQAQQEHGKLHRDEHKSETEEEEVATASVDEAQPNDDSSSVNEEEEGHEVRLDPNTPQPDSPKILYDGSTAVGSNSIGSNISHGVWSLLDGNRIGFGGGGEASNTRGAEVLYKSLSGITGLVVFSLVNPLAGGMVLLTLLIPTSLWKKALAYLGIKKLKTPGEKLKEAAQKAPQHLKDRQDEVKRFQDLGEQKNSLYKALNAMRGVANPTDPELKKVDEVLKKLDDLGRDIRNGAVKPDDISKRVRDTGIEGLTLGGTNAKDLDDAMKGYIKFLADNVRNGCHTLSPGVEQLTADVRNLSERGKQQRRVAAAAKEREDRGKKKAKEPEEAPLRPMAGDDDGAVVQKLAQSGKKRRGRTPDL